MPTIEGFFIPYVEATEMAQKDKGNCGQRLGLVFSVAVFSVGLVFSVAV